MYELHRSEGNKIWTLCLDPDTENPDQDKIKITQYSYNVFLKLLRDQNIDKEALVQ
jgi:hypothetical protein